MVAASRLLLQFAREPVPGGVKTRLIPALGAEGACQLHEELTRFTCRQLLASGQAPLELVVAGAESHPLFGECCALGARAVRSQRGEDLGERMYCALEEGLARASSVVLVGSDCPQLDAAYLTEAFSALEQVPVVLGPAADGGYVLIGVREVQQAWFRDIRWGGAQVLADTLQRLNETETVYRLLPERADIDRPEDLPLWQARELSD